MGSICHPADQSACSSYPLSLVYGNPDMHIIGLDIGDDGNVYVAYNNKMVLAFRSLR